MCFLQLNAVDRVGGGCIFGIGVAERMVKMMIMIMMIVIIKMMWVILENDHDHNDDDDYHDHDRVGCIFDTRDGKRSFTCAK